MLFFSYCQETAKIFRIFNEERKLGEIKTHRALRRHEKQRKVTIYLTNLYKWWGGNKYHKEEIRVKKKLKESKDTGEP